MRKVFYFIFLYDFFPLSAKNCEGETNQEMKPLASSSHNVKVQNLLFCCKTGGF